MGDPWIQLLIQVPLVAVFIYFVLEQGKQTATERRERTDLWIEDSRGRESQWREFIAHRDEQIIATLRDFKESITLETSFVMKQLEGSDARTDALIVEVKAMHIKFAQLEQVIVMSAEQMRQASEKRAIRKGKTGELSNDNI